MDGTTQKKQAVATHSRQADEFAERYAAGADSVYDSCFNYSRMRLDTLLERYLPPEGGGIRLLDVGCGTGHHLAGLSARGFSGVGVDGSSEMIVHARAENPGAEIVQADVEALPFPDNSFDIVLCVEVLRYLPEPERCIHEMARVLKPGGLCLATATPLLNLNGYAVVNRIALAVPVPSLVRLRQFFMTSRRLRRAFLAAGFGPPAIHGVYIGPLNWIQRLAPSRLPGFLRRWQAVDERLADRALSREFANMFLVGASRRGAEGS